jgi:hypothetical protein
LLGALAHIIAHAHDGGNDLPGFLHENPVANAQILSGNFFFVVESCSGNAAAADENRFELGHRGEHAGATDLHGDLEQSGFCLFGFVFVSNGPARGFGG